MEKSGLPIQAQNACALASTGLKNAATEKQNWLHISIVVAAGIVAAMQVIKPAITGPLLNSSLDIGLPSVGLLVSVFAMLGMVGGIPAGAVVAGLGDRRVLLYGLFTITVSALAGAMATRFGLLLATRILEGVGFTLVIVAGPALIARLAPDKNRPLALGLWSCFMPTGIALTMLCGPLFPNWQAVWMGGAIAATIVFLTALAVLPPSQTATQFSRREFYADIRATLVSGSPVVLAVIFALYSLQFFAIFSFLPVLLIERLHVSLQAAGMLSALATAMNISGNLAAGILIGKGVQRWLLIAIATLVMGLCSLGIFLPVLPNSAILLLCMLFSATGGLIPATLLATAPMLSPESRLAPFTMGLLMQGSNFGQVIGPVAVGTIIQIFGWTSVVTVSSLAAVLCIAMSLLLRQALLVR